MDTENPAEKIVRNLIGMTTQHPTPWELATLVAAIELIRVHVLEVEPFLAD